MRSQQQGVSSTKKKALEVFPNTPTPPPHESKRDIFIRVYKLKKTMYSNQTGIFPQVSSLGNKYIMVIHDVDSNSLWAEECHISELNKSQVHTSLEGESPLSAVPTATLFCIPC
jgi:hypothetical protein